jgi:hypothetical protein
VTAAGGIALRYGGFYGEPDQMTTAVARRRYPLVGDGRGMMPPGWSFPYGRSLLCHLYFFHGAEHQE